MILQPRHIAWKRQITLCLCLQLYPPQSQMSSTEYCFSINSLEICRRILGIALSLRGTSYSVDEIHSIYIKKLQITCG